MLIQTRELVKVYRMGGGLDAHEIRALDHVSVDIAKGEFVAVMGPSGSGKSTFMNVLGCLDRPSSGQYALNGKNVSELTGDELATVRNRNIGFVFQSYHLLDDQTVFENLELPLSYRDVGKKDRQSIVCDTLDKFQIVGKKDLFPSQLSGGQQQLVGIARAVVANPRIILADEPTGNLHSSQGKEIMDMFKRLNDEGTTIVQVTHSETNAAYGNRIVRLEDGWIANN